MEISQCLWQSRISQCLVPCFATVALPPPWSDSSAFTHFGSPSLSSCCPLLGTPHRLGSSILSFCPGMCLLANLAQKAGFRHMLSCLLVELTGSWVSGLSAPRAVVLDGPGEAWSVEMGRDPCLTSAMPTCDRQTSGPVGICPVPCGKWGHGQHAHGLADPESATVPWSAWTTRARF